jgi:hypothetical protein
MFAPLRLLHDRHNSYPQPRVEIGRTQWEVQKNTAWVVAARKAGYVVCDDDRCPCGSGQTFGIVMHSREFYDSLGS